MTKFHTEMAGEGIEYLRGSPMHGIIPSHFT
jgi:hypothetical protein